jgi:L-ascorbate metabolism protein UlaG (beta-lactamase superfamily)
MVRASLWFVVGCAGTAPPEVAKPEPEVAPAPEPAPAPAPPAAADTLGGLTVEPLYHATLALTADGHTWIVDPWSKAPLAGRTADVVLITDVHFDHLDKEAIAAVKKEGTLVVGPAAVGAEFPLDVTIANGETKEVAGVRVTAVPMYNLVRGPEEGGLFHDKGRGNGYLLEIGGQTVYVAGDTECTPEMKALTGVDVAFVPMNLPYTMPPEEAAACVAAFRPTVVYPYHHAKSDLTGFAAAVGEGVEVRMREWYPGGLPF